MRHLNVFTVMQLVRVVFNSYVRGIFSVKFTTCIKKPAPHFLFFFMSDTSPHTKPQRKTEIVPEQPKHHVK